MNTKILFAVSVLGMSVLTDVQAGQTLYTPVEGSFIKNPSALTFQSLGLQTSSVSTISLSGASYSQYMGWFKYQKNLYTMPLSVRPPNNTWLTAKLVDGGTISTRRLWTAFPYEVSSQVAKSAATSMFGSFPSGYCTNYAARAFFNNPEIKASYAPWKGNAKDWIVNARQNGWRTTTSTKEGFIGAAIVWNGGGFGHVGIVVDMYQTGKPGEIAYKIKEMNWGALVDVPRAITVNFGKVTEVTLLSTNLNRSASFPFIGFVLPARN